MYCEGSKRECPYLSDVNRIREAAVVHSGLTKDAGLEEYTEILQDLSTDLIAQTTSECTTERCVALSFTVTLALQNEAQARYEDRLDERRQS